MNCPEHPDTTVCWRCDEGAADAFLRAAAPELCELWKQTYAKFRLLTPEQLARLREAAAIPKEDIE